MIDLKVTALGVPEIAAKLGMAESGIRDVLRAELAQVGSEIVAGAQARAPKRTGVLASRIIWFFGREVMRRRPKNSILDGGPTKYRTIVEGASKYAKKSTRAKWENTIFFTARPTGSVAHLMERGVNATFYQRPGRRTKDASRRDRRGYAAVGPFAGEAMQGPDFRYQRTLKIDKRPFFMPAVEAAGGSAGVNARLQGALDNFARNLV